MAKVTIILGSISDKEKMEGCALVLRELGVDYFCTVASAHRSPDRVENIVREAEEGGTQVFICAAGMAAHLAGAVAARAIRPVIGVPLSGSALAGMDALFSTVQMPAGFPVAAVALDKAGAKNAAFLAAQILALSDSNLAAKLRVERQKAREAAEKAARELEAELNIKN